MDALIELIELRPELALKLNLAQITPATNSIKNDTAYNSQIDSPTNEICIQALHDFASTEDLNKLIDAKNQ